MAFEPVPCACGGDGSAGVACTPYEQTGLCLADGTPIAVVTSRDCTTGVVTQIGWLNLTTGAFTAGPPPAGAVACGGGQSIQVSGVFCDVLPDDTVAGLVLVEYHYAADGSIDTVRLVDAATGATYVLQGELSVCPGGAEGVALDVETKLMCLVETATGNVLGQVLGEFVYNTQTGARVSARFVDPATGFPVTIPGGVVPRECPEEPCRDCETIQLCDVGNQPAAPVTTGTVGTRVLANGVTVTADAIAVSGQTRWNIATFPRPALGPINFTFDQVVSATWDAEVADSPAGTRNSIVMPPGTVLVAKHANHTWDAATRTLTSTATAVVGATPLQVSTFRNAGPVKALAFSAPAGSGTVSTARRVGNIVVTPLSPVPFLRTVCRDCDGAVISTTDTELDGTTAYVVAGSAESCDFAADCRDCETVRLCDSKGPVINAPTTATDTAFVTAGPGQRPRAGGGAALWAGGSLDFPPEAAPPVDGQDQTQVYRGVSAEIAAERPDCDTGDVVITSTVHITHTASTGPGFGTTGQYRLMNGDTQLQLVNVPSGTVVGYEQTLKITGTVPAADLAAGNVRIDLMLETNQGDEQGWTADTFTLVAQYNGCPVPFLRTTCRDCNGLTVSVADTNMSGAPYILNGVPVDCAGVTNKGCIGAVEVVKLCDLNPDVAPDSDGRKCATPFLRTLVFDCDGVLVETRDATLDGEPYTAIAPLDCGASGIPALVELPWPQTGIAEDPAGLPAQDFIYTVTNPDTGEAATVHLHASRAAGGSCGPYNPTNPAFNNPTAYTLTLSPEAQAMTSFRLDLLDFDMFENVSGLNPLPSRVEGDAKWFGSTVINPTKDGGVAHVYWDKPPAQITYGYGNFGGGIACSSVAFQGLTYKAEGCCGCAAGSADQPCRDTTSLLVCDLPTGGDPTPTVTDTPPAPYYPYTTGVATPGAQVLWDGGTLTLPAATGPQPGTTGTVRNAAAIIQAPRPACDSGTAHVSVSVDVTQLGPDDGCLSSGFIGLYNGTGEANRVALALAPKNTPAGWAGTLTVEADVPADDLAAGSIAVAMAFDAYDDSGAACPPPRSTGWEISAFSADVVFEQTDCETQFLRNVVTDCETGAVVAVNDTTMDGQPYIPTGEVGQCTAAGGGGPVEPCRNTSSLLVCDLPTGGAPDPTVTNTSPVPYQNQAGAVPVTGDPSVLWSGGAFNIAPDTAPPPDGSTQFARTFAATVQAPRPGCDTGTATVTATIRAQRTGPDPGCAGTGAFQLKVGTTLIAADSTTTAAPVGNVDVLTITGHVPAADLAAGNVALYGVLETYQRSAVLCPGGSAPDGARIGGWILDDFSAEVVYDQTDCETQFLRNVVTDCETGQVVTVTDTTVDGAPYVVTGEVGVCRDVLAPDCCQPETVCLQQNPVQIVEFISNEARVDDDSIDTVWTWTPDGDANGPLPAATWYQTYRATYSANPGAWSVVDTDTGRPAGWISPHPDGETHTTGAPGEGPSIVEQPWWARASFNLPDSADPASIRVQITVLNADQVANRFRLNDGAWQTMPPPPVGAYNGTPFTFGPGVLDGAQPGLNTLYFEVQETIPDQPGNGAGVMAHFIVTYELGRPGRRQWTRMLCCDGTFYYLDEAGDRQDELPENWSVAACGSGETAPLVLCDDAGPFLRHVTYLPDGDLLVSDTALDGTPYTPVGTVGDCAALAAGTSVQLQRMLDCPSAGGPDCVQFLRHYRYDATGSPVGFTDTDLAGAPYTPTGIVG